MEGSARDDVRRLLKEFGVKADEAVISFLIRNEDIDTIDIRLTMEDLTNYGTRPPDEPLDLKVEGSIHRRK